MPVLHSLTLYRQDRGNRTTITMTGDIDMTTVPALGTMIARCLHEGIQTIHVDLTDLTFCDVSGLNTFLVCAKRTTSAGGSLCLYNPRPTVARLLEITGTEFLLHHDQPAPAANGLAAMPHCPLAA